LLRMLGGHATIDEGEFLLDGVRTNDVPPARRDISTVFQHYGLFPHKSVRDNVEFGLKMRSLPREARRRRAEEALNFLDLTSMADRRPRQLSGGQQQRVALARALVTEPTVLLLDEPLGDLDRLLQLRMRVELRALQRRLRITFIHVTHNQEEALAIADQIVVMENGRIQQVGRPQDVYRHPANLFTSGFMGDNNVVPGQVSAIDGGHVRVEGDGLTLLARHDGTGVSIGQSLHASVRASCVSAATALADGSEANPERPNQVTARLIFLEYLGDVVKLHCRLPNGQAIVAKRAENDRAWDGLIEGEPVRLEWEPEDVQLLLA
ncbi:MAG TPA: ABC transporter ATP-binding protein, partial [Thermomicrobiales bacterium]|nr:ABC transporter ATP-binding protein [Thermomicrobiales bacterium]